MDETDGLLVSCGRFIKISSITEMIEPTIQGVPEVSEAHRFERVTIWGEANGLLPSRDRFVKISNVAQAPEPTYPRLLRGDHRSPKKLKSNSTSSSENSTNGCKLYPVVEFNTISHLTSETDGALLTRDRLIKINNVASSEGFSEIIEICRRARVAIWDETDGLLLSRDRFIDISNIAQVPKTKRERVPQVTETPWLAGVTIWGETDDQPESRNYFINISNVAQTLETTFEGDT